MTIREARIDQAVRGVMKLGQVPQGYRGSIDCDRKAVRAWLEAGCVRDAWWFAFTSAVQTFYRRSLRTKEMA